MTWCPAPRKSSERDFRVETHGEQLRVELYRGGRLQAVRTFSKHGVEDACGLGKRWLLLGPAVFVLEQLPQAA